MPSGKNTRPDIDEYMMRIAREVQSRANCLGRHVGAVLAREGHIVSTGYNGTPHGMLNCDEGGCSRCKNPELFPSGMAYDVCICVHAEQNALLSAARFGISVVDSILYTTTRPCFGCAKESLQAGVKGIRYNRDWQHPNSNLIPDYERLMAAFKDKEKCLEIPDD